MTIEEKLDIIIKRTADNKVQFNVLTSTVNELLDLTESLYSQLTKSQARCRQLEDALRQLAECDLNERNCASLEVATKRIKNLAIFTLNSSSTETKPLDPPSNAGKDEKCPKCHGELRFDHDDKEMSDGNRRFACKCGFACEAAWSDKTETYIPKIATPTPTYTKKDSVWWPAICPRCGWRGLSEDCEGGGPMGDTGDYSEVTCPRCGNNVDDDEEAKVEEK